MYKKIKEEKEIIEEEVTKLEALIQRYEKQVKIGTSSLKNNQENLQVARDDLQNLRLENITLKNKINDLQRRNEDFFLLYLKILIIGKKLDFLISTVLAIIFFTLFQVQVPINQCIKK